MKPLKDIQKKIIEESFIDPPTVLVLRRKAIRMFPRGQRVATYRNDNLKIDVAIPYNPDTLGKGHIDTVAGISEAMSPELKKLRKDRAMFKHDLSKSEDSLESAKARLSWAKNALAGHIKKHGKLLDPIGECIYSITENIQESPSDELFGNYLHKPHKNIETKVQEKYGANALHHFVRAASHYNEGDHETANHHFQKYKHAANIVGENVINELSKQTLGSYVKKASSDAADNIDKANHYTPKPIKYHRDRAKKRLNGIEHATASLVKEDIVMEASIHSLHAITKTKHPAQVRFKDGSSAMVDHPTAAQIMKLHSKVNRENKKKVEGLINSGPAGIKKVSEFIRNHMKD